MFRAQCKAVQDLIWKAKRKHSSAAMSEISGNPHSLVCHGGQSFFYRKKELGLSSPQHLSALTNVFRFLLSDQDRQDQRWNRHTSESTPSVDEYNTSGDLSHQLHSGHPRWGSNIYQAVTGKVLLPWPYSYIFGQGTRIHSGPCNS